MDCQTECGNDDFYNKKCSAVGEYGKQCNNNIFKGNHCIIHYKKAKDLYIKYKKTCQIAYNINIKKEFSDINEKIDYLKNSYKWFEEAYNSRLEHRKYAFVPKFWNIGHDLQFSIMLDKICQCEDMLYLAWENKEKNINNIIVCNPRLKKDIKKPKSTKKISPEITPEKIKKFKEKRNVDKEEEQKLLEKFIEENKEYNKIQTELAFLCNKIMENFFEKEYDAEENKIIKILFYNIIKTLYNIEYFTSYKPVSCQVCKSSCGGFAPVFVKKVCGCIFRYKNFINFLTNLTNESLRLFYETLLRNEKILKLFFKDLINLYNIYDSQLMTKILVILEWKKELNRLQIALDIPDI